MKGIEKKGSGKSRYNCFCANSKRLRHFVIPVVILILTISAIVYANTIIRDTGTSEFGSEINTTNVSTKDIITKDNPTDIRYFGAIPNDGISDSVAIEKANDYLIDSGGGTMYFPAGTWDINDTIQAYGGIKYKGSTVGYVSNGTIISLLPYSNVTMINISNNPTGGNSYFAHLQDLMLYGNNLTQSGESNGIISDGLTYDAYLTNINVFGTHDWGVKLTSGKFWINNLYTEYCNKGINVDGAVYVFMNNVYDIFSYERSFDVYSVGFMGVTNGIIGSNRGVDKNVDSIFVNHTSGDIKMNNIRILGGESAANSQSTIINLSNSGSSTITIGDSSIRSASTDDYGIWISDSLSGNRYNLHDLVVAAGTIKSNGAQYSEKHDNGTYFRNQRLKVDNLTMSNILSLGRASSGQAIIGNNATFTNTFLILDTEDSNATDELNCLHGGKIGDLVYIRTSSAGRDITLHNNNCSTTVGEIYTDGGGDLALTITQDYVHCLRMENQWSCFLVNIG